MPYTKCKNEAMNDVGLGRDTVYPRSCPQCHFGPCKWGITRDPHSTIEERYYVGMKQDMLAAEKRNEQKYGVILTEKVYHPGTEGDQRSRDCPGHGYPAQPGYTENVEKFKPFKDEAELKRWIQFYGDRYKPYKVIRYQEMTVKTEVQVTLG